VRAVGDQSGNCAAGKVRSTHALCRRRVKTDPLATGEI
jgi:hypothetical protein